jgi:hypothetical protein
MSEPKSNGINETIIPSTIFDDTNTTSSTTDTLTITETTSTTTTTIISTTNANIIPTTTTVKATLLIPTEIIPTNDDDNIIPTEINKVVSGWNLFGVIIGTTIIIVLIILLITFLYKKYCRKRVYFKIELMNNDDEYEVVDYWVKPKNNKKQKQKNKNKNDYNDGHDDEIELIAENNKISLEDSEEDEFFMASEGMEINNESQKAYFQSLPGETIREKFHNLFQFVPVMGRYADAFNQQMVHKYIYPKSKFLIINELNVLKMQTDTSDIDPLFNGENSKIFTGILYNQHSHKEFKFDSHGNFILQKFYQTSENKNTIDKNYMNILKIYCAFQKAPNIVSLIGYNILQRVLIFNNEGESLKSIQDNYIANKNINNELITSNEIEPTNLKFCFNMLNDILSALNFIHQNDCAHVHINSEHILYNKNNEFKLTGFSTAFVNNNEVGDTFTKKQNMLFLNLLIGDFQSLGSVGNTHHEWSKSKNTPIETENNNNDNKITFENADNLDINLQQVIAIIESTEGSSNNYKYLASDKLNQIKKLRNKFN